MRGRAEARHQAEERAGKDSARVCMASRFRAYADNKRTRDLKAVWIIRAVTGSCLPGDVVAG
jgi:hypothetical protein